MLVELARRWEKFVRSSDMLARIGGEEFCVLLNDSTRNQAMVVAEKLRLAACMHPVIHQCRMAGRQEIPVTVSIGISTLADTDTTSDEAIARADTALYRAKANGRNRVESAVKNV